MKSLISIHCFISLRVKSNTKKNFFTKEKNVNYGLKLIKCQYWFTNLKEVPREFPGGSVVRTPHFHCCGSRFNPWSGN